MARKTLLACTYFNIWLEIHTNASEFLLGVVIFQEGKLIALYSRKLARPQKVYGNRKFTTKHHQNFEIVLNYINTTNVKNLY